MTDLSSAAKQSMCARITHPPVVTEPEVPHVVDVRGPLCVQLRLRPVVEAIPSGVVVQVATDDPAAPLDLTTWFHLTSHHYLDRTNQISGRRTRIKISAGARQVDHRMPWAPRL